jgi:subtilisin family serine protease
MSKKLTVWTLLLTVLFYAGSGPKYRAQILSPNDSVQRFRPDEIIVEIIPGASISDVNQRNQTTTIRRIYGTNYYRLRIPVDVKENTLIEKLKSDPDVIDAWRNTVLTSPFTSMSRSIMSFPDGWVNPNRTAQEYQSQFQIFDQVLKLGDAHLRSTGQGTVVAVIDTGVDLNHPVLASRIWTDDPHYGEVANDGIDNDNDGLIDDYRGWDFIANDNNPTEVAADPRLTVAGHGTFIAGLIAQVAPDSRIMPVRAFTPQGDSDEFTVAEAIKYAADHGANVINLSFGSREDFHVLREAIEYAQRKSVLVAAAGNENASQPPQYPANITETVI